jgi:hypothetical protein
VVNASSNFAATMGRRKVPSKSKSQARMMAGASHNPIFAKKVGVPQKVAKEFNKADKGTGILKGPKKPRPPASDEVKLKRMRVS